MFSIRIPIFEGPTEGLFSLLFKRQALFIVSVLMAKPVFVVSVLTAKPVFIVSVLTAKPLLVVSVGLRMFQKI